MAKCFCIKLLQMYFYVNRSAKNYGFLKDVERRATGKMHAALGCIKENPKSTYDIYTFLNFSGPSADSPSERLSFASFPPRAAMCEYCANF